MIVNFLAIYSCGAQGIFDSSHSRYLPRRCFLEHSPQKSEMIKTAVRDPTTYDNHPQFQKSISKHDPAEKRSKMCSVEVQLHVRAYLSSR